MHAEGAARRVPEIEVLEELAERPMRQDIVPPWIVFRGGHVVRHDIQQDAQALRTRALRETRPRGLAAEVRADPRGIRDVVAMLAAGNGLQTGREVYMADA